MSMFVEAWINQGLLSNPATHMMNMVIGAANVARLLKGFDRNVTFLTS